MMSRRLAHQHWVDFREREAASSATPSQTPPRR
jgi:hypothetical protein